MKPIILKQVLKQKSYKIFKIGQEMRDQVQKMVFGDSV